MSLITTTTTLIKECDNASERFFEMRALDMAPDFYGQVKPHADQVHALLRSFQQQAYKWIEEDQPKYMHKQLIDNAVDAMEQFVVQSFYKETSKKRFIQSVQSVHYTLSTIVRRLEEGDVDA